MASSSDLESMPISLLHEKAREQLEDYKSGRRAVFADALRALDQLERAVDRAGLFSSNEDKDDLQTSCLQYLMVSFLKAELLASSPATDPAERHQHLASAQAAYSAYLQQCHQYGLLGNKGSQIYTLQEEGKQQDANSRRTEKIERFKRNKALTGLIEQLLRMKTHTGEDDLSAHDSSAVGGVGAWDEEDERQLWLLRLEQAALSALDAQPVLQQELTLMNHVLSTRQGHQQEGASPASSSSSSRPHAASSAGGAAEADAAAKAAMAARLRDISQALSCNGREQAMQQVFRPSHILPTMTVEQQGVIEARDAAAREARQRQAEVAVAAARASMTDEEVEEEERLKAAAMDDFKDDNPRGWGNSKLRPCAL